MFLSLLIRLFNFSKPTPTSLISLFCLFYCLTHIQLYFLLKPYCFFCNFFFHINPHARRMWHVATLLKSKFLKFHSMFSLNYCAAKSFPGKKQRSNSTTSNNNSAANSSRLPNNGGSQKLLVGGQTPVPANLVTGTLNEIWVSKFNFQATKFDELTLTKNMRVLVIQKEGDGWWLGQDADVDQVTQGRLSFVTGCIFTSRFKPIGGMF